MNVVLSASSSMLQCCSGWLPYLLLSHVDTVPSAVRFSVTKEELHRPWKTKMENSKKYFYILVQIVFGDVVLYRLRAEGPRYTIGLTGLHPWPLLLKMNGCQHLCSQGAEVEELDSALEMQYFFFSWDSLVYLENENYIKVIYVK